MEVRENNVKRHDLFFLKQGDARKALWFIENVLASRAILSDYSVTFFTPQALNLIEQVIILQHINTYRPMFNMSEV